MIWLVNAVGPVSSIPLSIDSSDAAVLEAGLDAIDPAWAGGATAMINSASVERPVVDPLIIPIGVDPSAGTAYLDAVSTIRERFGDDIHITGGISNISFGLPARRIISDVFLDLCVQAGHDSGIIDPVAAKVEAALNPDREAESYKLAAAMLTGEDAFGMKFIEAFRAGALS